MLCSLLLCTYSDFTWSTSGGRDTDDDSENTEKSILEI